MVIPEDPPPPGTPTNAEGIAEAGVTGRVTGEITAVGGSSLEPGGFLRDGEESSVVDAFLLKSRVTKSDVYHRQQGEK